jgi:hypothetical protein
VLLISFGWDFDLVGFCGGVVDVFVLVGCDAVSLDNWFPIFRDHCVVSKCGGPNSQ